LIVANFCICFVRLQLTARICRILPVFAGRTANAFAFKADVDSGAINE